MSGSDKYSGEILAVGVRSCLALYKQRQRRRVAVEEILRANRSDLAVAEKACQPDAPELQVGICFFTA